MPRRRRRIPLIASAPGCASLCAWRNLIPSNCPASRRCRSCTKIAPCWLLTTAQLDARAVQLAAHQSRNLQAAIVIHRGEGLLGALRSLKFLRYVHRLDAETTGILLFAKSQGRWKRHGDLFESRRMEKPTLR